eukprot:CAMPEP_0119508926 /NCGR_PEP_ID=MMETSP1344-20130328/28385_1 /TAXON_ID=236787 /ORGANISM="Florenciella parvula, Strain CCMP2471" /LENGTH=36 /DNA_ID= /DNA_START= /DNA_END= /DNA_ORIENTATION=
MAATGALQDLLDQFSNRLELVEKQLSIDGSGGGGGG